MGVIGGGMDACVDVGRSGSPRQRDAIWSVVPGISILLPCKKREIILKKFVDDVSSRLASSTIRTVR